MNNTIHRLKTDPQVFAMSMSGCKPWEIRLNDRNFKAGDLIILRETKCTGEEMSRGEPLVYTGRELSRLVIYVMSYTVGYGLKDDWVIMTVEKI